MSPEFYAIRQYIKAGNANESFDDTLERIRYADLVASFTDLDDLDEDV